MISVLIPTKNEEQDLPGCLDSVSWCDDVHVYDSGSMDKTVEVAESRGAHTTVSPLISSSHIFGGNEAEHKQWALRNLAFRHRWVLHLDADERVTPGLQASIHNAVRDPGSYVAFRIQRRDFLQDRWLRHVQATPFYLRLFRPQCIQYERLINPVAKVSGPTGDLKGYLDHFPFSKGLSYWLERHNSYSTLEARQILANRLAGGSFSAYKALLANDFTQRRFHQKELFYRLPGRPILKFMMLYLGKRGFLDGRAGFTYAMLQSFYEYMIVLKTREFARDAKIESRAMCQASTDSTAAPEPQGMI
jgi:glycosyltransferase involved in cell wall biosynthesis